MFICPLLVIVISITPHVQYEFAIGNLCQRVKSHLFAQVGIVTVRSAHLPSRWSTWLKEIETHTVFSMTNNVNVDPVCNQFVLVYAALCTNS